ncbi:hypothetical protein KCP74_23640 [Salmonella enterica subsp. enterica]|nr:hypothetical protein KCP74_23640 [Salmonella enterica subsp. enterica]
MRIITLPTVKCANRLWRYACAAGTRRSASRYGGGVATVGFSDLSAAWHCRGGRRPLPLDTGYPDDRLRMMLKTRSRNC